MHALQTGKRHYFTFVTVFASGVSAVSPSWVMARPLMMSLLVMAISMCSNSSLCDDPSVRYYDSQLLNLKPLYQLKNYPHICTEIVAFF